MTLRPIYEELERRPRKVATGAVEPNRTERGQGELEESFLAKKSVVFIAGILILFALYLSSLYNYLLFHSLAEIFSIVVAWTIFVLVWNSRRIMDNNYLLFIGIAYLFIGGLDLVHTLGYRGMEIFHGYGADLPTQLWIASRYMESLSLLIAPLFLTRRLKADLVLMIYALVTALVLGSVFYWHIFPTCFVEGIGLTPFKKLSEYIISIILLGAITFLFQKRKEFDEKVFRLLVAAMVLTIGAELAFTFYISAYGFSNLVGHYFKIISFYFIYKAIIETGLKKPYNLLFRSLKQNEEALKRSRGKYKTLFSNAQIALFRTGISDGKLIEINQRYANMAGYSNVEDCMAEFNAADSWADSNARDEFVEILEKEGAVKDYETEIIRRDGTRLWRMFSATIFPEHGFLEGSIVDISDRKQAERELGESEEKHRALIENLSDAILILNKDGLNVWNSPAVRQYGLEPEDAIGRPFDEFIHPDDIGKSRKSWEEMIANPGKVFTVEHRASGTPENPDTWIYQHNKLVYLPDVPGIKGVVCVCRNETEQKLSEIALRGSEEKYRNILESIEEGYYEVDLAGKFTFVNDAMCKIRGYTREELIGMNNRQYMTEETAKMVFKAFSNVYTTGNPTKSLEWETVRKDGTKRFVETSTFLLKDSKDVPIGFRGIDRDVSEKNRLETQLQKAQRMESIGTLAGGIAHNFNNLLMGIQGNASILFLDIDSSHPRHKNLKNIEKLIDNGAKLTAQLIGYAREGKYEVKPTSLNQLVKDTSDTFGMTQKKITVHQELSEDLHGIEADQGQIEQILLNLYVNAVEAMPGGGNLFLKTMNVTDKDMSGKLYKATPGNYVLLTVRDTGIGMDKETRERIFEPFFTTKGLASGTGLGLASTYGIVKGHGGYVDVDSEKGKGTTFSIYLPATEEMIKHKNELSDELVKGKGTVLLVDDEEMVLEVGKELLKHLGYEALLAENGREALGLYKKNQNKIDLVLLDMVMPVMGGGEAFDRMKEINSNVKVLLSSGYSLEGEAKEILKRGCDAFIQKPFKMEQLSQKLRGVLNKK